MEGALSFYPPRQPGTLLHLGLLPIPLLAGGIALFQALRFPVGMSFFLYLLVFLVAAVLVLWFAYRLYALQRAVYSLEREGVRVQWGLRAEVIPMPDVLWARRAAVLDHPLQKPRLTLPGALLGTRRDPELGQVEFLAADPGRLVVIATPARTFVISPEDPDSFLRALRRLVELGSLEPLPARSIGPGLLAANVWEDRGARVLLSLSLTLGLAVIVWVALLLPARAEIAIGFTAEGLPRRPSPAVRLTLLPVINSFFLVLDLILGIYFYRQPENRPLAYFLWSVGALASGLFLLVIYLISR
jgi:hypothetical protein